MFSRYILVHFVLFQCQNVCSMVGKRVCVFDQFSFVNVFVANDLSNDQTCTGIELLTRLEE